MTEIAMIIGFVLGLLVFTFSVEWAFSCFLIKEILKLEANKERTITMEDEE